MVPVLLQEIYNEFKSWLNHREISHHEFKKKIRGIANRLCKIASLIDSQEIKDARDMLVEVKAQLRERKVINYLSQIKDIEFNELQKVLDQMILNLDGTTKICSEDMKFLRDCGNTLKGISVHEDSFNIERRVLLGGLAGLGIFGIARGAYAISENKHMPRINWKIKAFFQREGETESLILYQVPERLSKLVSKMTENHFKIDYENMEKATTDQMLREVQNDDLDCAFSGIYYSDEGLNALYFGCAIPFGLTVQEQIAWLNYKKNEDDEFTYMQLLYQQLRDNIIAFPVACTGAQMGGWFNEIPEIKDGKLVHSSGDTFRFRIPGLGEQVFRELGSETRIHSKGIEAHEIENFLERGILHGAEWVGPVDDVTLNLHKVKYQSKSLVYCYPGWWEPSTTFDLLVSKKEYEKLPEHYKVILKQACGQVFSEILTEYNLKNRKIFSEIILGSIDVKPFSYEFMAASMKATEIVLENNSGSNMIFRETYDDWKKFKQEIRSWSQLETATNLFDKLYQNTSISDDFGQQIFGRLYSDL